MQEVFELGRLITVEIEKGGYRFNGECNAALEHEFKELLDEGLECSCLGRQWTTTGDGVAQPLMPERQDV